MTQAFTSAFFDEIEKIAVLPLVGAAAMPALKAAGSGAAMALGGAAVNKALQPKQPKLNKQFNFDKSAAAVGMVGKVMANPAGNALVQGGAMAAGGALFSKLTEPRRKKERQAPPPQGNFQYEQ